MEGSLKAGFSGDVRSQEMEETSEPWYSIHPPQEGGATVSGSSEQINEKMFKNKCQVLLQQYFEWTFAQKNKELIENEPAKLDPVDFVLNMMTNASRESLYASMESTTTSTSDDDDINNDGMDVVVVSQQALDAVMMVDFNNDGRFEREDYPHSPQVRELCKMSYCCGVDILTCCIKGFQKITACPFCKTVNHRFQLTKFRPYQLQAINAALLDHDVLLVLATGGGKSLCFQLPALLSSGVTIVVSPMLSLISDQLHKLSTLNINSCSLTSELTIAETVAQIQLIQDPAEGVKIVFVTPEKLEHSLRLRAMLDTLNLQNRLSRFVVDECHCIVQYGNTFRSAYQKLNSLRTRYPAVNIMAITATANPTARIEIMSSLRMKQTTVILIGKLTRKNLKYDIRPKGGSKNSTMDKVIQLLTSYSYQGLCGIIYCFTVKLCEDVALQLGRYNVKIRCYHSRLSKDEKQLIVKEWVDNKIQVICGTSALGLGIDKSNVRFVIHIGVPTSLEEYIQQTGRAGRDGKTARCILFYDYNDSIQVLGYQLKPKSPAKIKHILTKNMTEMVRFCENVFDCRRKLMLQHLGNNDEQTGCPSPNGQTACSNCSGNSCYTLLNLTQQGQEVVNAVKSINFAGDKMTVKQLAKFMKSFKTGVNQTALFPNWMSSDVERLIIQLILQDYLGVTTKQKPGILAFHNYLVCGPKANLLISANATEQFFFYKWNGKRLGTIQNSRWVDMNGR